MWAWARAGKCLPHSSGGQMSATQRISADQLQPGDLVFYGSPVHHVAMYIGGGQVIHAPQLRQRREGRPGRGTPAGSPATAASAERPTTADSTAADIALRCAGRSDDRRTSRSPVSRPASASMTGAARRGRVAEMPDRRDAQTVASFEQVVDDLLDGADQGVGRVDGPPRASSRSLRPTRRRSVAVVGDGRQVDAGGELEAVESVARRRRGPIRSSPRSPPTWRWLRPAASMTPAARLGLSATMSARPAGELEHPAAAAADDDRRAGLLERLGLTLETGDPVVLPVKSTGPSAHRARDDLEASVEASIRIDGTVQGEPGRVVVRRSSSPRRARTRAVPRSAGRWSPPPSPGWPGGGSRWRTPATRPAGASVAIGHRHQRRRSVPPGRRRGRRRSARSRRCPRIAGRWGPGPRARSRCDAWTVKRNGSRGTATG